MLVVAPCKSRPLAAIHPGEAKRLLAAAANMADAVKKDGKGLERKNGDLDGGAADNFQSCRVCSVYVAEMSV
jgi:hypothetical protein